MYFNIFKNDRLIFARVLYCSSLWQRFRGFMFSSEKSGKHLIFPGTKAIHMWFVFFPLDIIVLDKTKKVIAKFRIKPWQVSRFFPEAYYLIETTAEKQAEKIKLGDRLEFKKIDA